jgi:hypothetical protein
MAKLIPDQLSMFSQMKYGTSPNATSSQESQDGHTPLDLQDGQTKEKSGREAARASRLALQEKAKELTMSGIYGRTFFDSLEAVVPQSSWVSKLQARLGMVGSTESDLIWKVKATPSMASIFRLAPQTRRTSDQDCIGWRTPNTRDGMQSGYEDMEKLANRWERGKQVQLCDQVKMATSTTWATPKARDWKDTAGCSPTGINPDGSIRNRMDRLCAQAAVTWPTPTKADHWNPSTHQSAQREWEHHNLRGIEAFGTTPSGSQEQTGKRGALNPEFVCWLMGFPPEWESCAPTAMPSSRRSRQK